MKFAAKYPGACARKAMLVCVIDDMSGAIDGGMLAQRNCRNLISRWEDATVPYAYMTKPKFVLGRSVAHTRLDVPPGHLVIELAQPSLFRDNRFIELYRDLGAPPIVLIGSDLRRTITASVVDGHLGSFSPIAVVADAVGFSDASIESMSWKSSDTFNILRNFARILEARELRDGKISGW